jgi:glutamine amidotransferase
MNVLLLNYGAGNVTSVLRAVATAGANPRVAIDSGDMAEADAIVVPGVGQFGSCAAIPHRMRMAVFEATRRGVPLLGICLGLQWLFEGSDEAPDVPGLGLFPGRCSRLETRGFSIKVPHVGWNALDRTARPSRLLDGVPAGATGYFTHSYAAPVVAETTATAEHGAVFTAVVERGAVFGVQCHPEKSGLIGLQILRNFLTVAGSPR